MGARSSEAVIIQMSSRGQVTLPSSVRSKIGVHGGDPFLVTVEDGRVVLSPAIVSPVENYTEERITEFDTSASMTDDEIAKARVRWGL
jgi:AbrB family looped-hinge helix DNA binding protein